MNILYVAFIEYLNYILNCVYSIILIIVLSMDVLVFVGKAKKINHLSFCSINVTKNKFLVSQMSIAILADSRNLVTLPFTISIIINNFLWWCIWPGSDSMTQSRSVGVHPYLRLKFGKNLYK